MSYGNIMRANLDGRNPGRFIPTGRLKGWTPGDVSTLRRFLALQTRIPAKGLGDSGVIMPSFTPVTPSAVQIPDYSTFSMPAAPIEPAYLPTTSGGAYIPSSSPLFPLTIPAPGMTPAQSSYNVASLINAAGQAASSLISPAGIPFGSAPVPSGSLSSWMSGTSSLGISNGTLLIGALGVGALILVVARKR